jgi:hypothetical protein
LDRRAHGGERHVPQHISAGDVARALVARHSLQPERPSPRPCAPSSLETHHVHRRRGPTSSPNRSQASTRPSYPSTGRSECSPARSSSGSSPSARTSARACPT